MSKKFANVAWAAADIRTAGKFSSDEAAETWLVANEKYIRDGVIEKGWTVIESLLRADGVAESDDVDDLPFANTPTMSGIYDPRLYEVSSIKWNLDEEDEDKETTVMVYAPASLEGDALQEFLSDAVTNWGGLCHNGFDFNTYTNNLGNVLDGWIVMNSIQAWSEPFLLRGIRYRSARITPVSAIVHIPKNVDPERVVEQAIGLSVCGYAISKWEKDK